jgi:hypothetical protein
LTNYLRRWEKKRKWKEPSSYPHFISDEAFWGLKKDRRNSNESYLQQTNIECI